MTKITETVAEKMLGDVPQDKWFYCADGRFLKNLPELDFALKGMSDETYCYHSNDAKSDFSKWVTDVVDDAKLSRDLQKSTSRTKAAKSVADRIAWLRSKTITK